MEKILAPLKFFYSALHAEKWPTGSTVLFMAVAAIIAGLIWHRVGEIVRKENAATPPLTQPTITTVGPLSPVLPNNSGNVTITSGGPDGGHSVPKERPK